MALQRLIRNKDQGNQLFREGDLQKAREVYKSVLQELNELGLSEEVIELETTCRNNLASIEIREGNWNKALKQGRKVLRFRENAKASFRCATALWHLGNYKEGARYVQKAEQLEPFDKAIMELGRKYREALGQEFKEVEVKQQQELPNAPSGKIDLSDIRGGQQQEVIRQMQENPQQMSGMMDMIKNMDPKFLQQMMQGYGLNMSAEQITQMTSMMNPDMLQRGAQMMQQQRNGAVPNQVQTQQTPVQPQMPDLSNMTGMMNQMMGNPAMSQMMGEMLSKQFGARPETMQYAISAATKLLNVYQKGSRVYQFFFGGIRKYWTFSVLAGFIAWYFEYIQ